MNVPDTCFFNDTPKCILVKLRVFIRAGHTTDICQHLYIKKLQHSNEVCYGMGGVANGVNLQSLITLVDDKVKNILFVCSMNKWRSPTAEAIFRNSSTHNVRSAGTAGKCTHKN